MEVFNCVCVCVCRCVIMLMHVAMHYRKVLVLAFVRRVLACNYRLCYDPERQERGEEK